MSSRNRAPLVLGSLLLALVALTAWSLKAFSRYQPYSGFFGANTRLDKQFVVQLADVDVRYRKSGRPLWRVHADRMTLSVDRRRLVADGVSDGVMLDGARPLLRFAAGEAIYTQGFINPEMGDLEVLGRIRIVSVHSLSPVDAQVSIDAAHALWSGMTGVLQCPQPLRARFVRADWTKPVDVSAQSLVFDSRQRVLRFPAAVTLLCPEPGNPSANRISVSSSDVVWERRQSLIRCDAPARIVYPLAGAQQPIVIDARAASFDQNTGTVSCPTEASARIVLPHTSSVVKLDASRSSWSPRTGLLIAPGGAHADVASLGAVDCDAPQIDTRTRTLDFAHIRLTASDAAIGAAPDAAPQPPAKVDPNRVYVDAAEGGHWDEQQSVLTLRGPVKFTQGDAVMRMIGAIWNRKTGIAVAQSPVTLTDPENTLTGVHGQVNFRTKRFTLDTSVILRQTPKDTPPSSDSNDFNTVANEPTDMTCDRLVYNYRDKTAIATGHVVIIQKHRTVSADSGTYDSNTRIAQLEGHVVGVTDDNRLLRAPRATVSLKKGDQWIEFPNQMDFEFTPDAEDNPRANAAPAKPAPAPRPDGTASPSGGPVKSP